MVEEQKLVNQIPSPLPLHSCLPFPLPWVSVSSSTIFFSPCLLLFNMKKSFQKLQWKAQFVLPHSCSKDTVSGSSCGESLIHL